MAKLTDADTDEIVKLYQKPMSAMSIAKLYGVTPPTIARRLVERGVYVKNRRLNRVLSEDDLREMIAIYQRGGIGIRKMGNQFGVDHIVIKHHLKKAGVYTRTHAESLRLSYERGNRQNNLPKNYTPVDYHFSGVELAEARAKAKMTQKQVADALCVKPDLVREWERGKVPSGENMLRLLILYKCSPKSFTRKKEHANDEN